MNENESQHDLCPEKFYTVKKAPKDDSKRHTMLGELQKTIAKRSISQGNDDTFKHAHARFKQVIAEVEEMLASLLTGPVEKPEAVSDAVIHKNNPRCIRNTKSTSNAYEKCKADEEGSQGILTSDT